MSGPLTNDMWKIGDWIEERIKHPLKWLFCILIVAALASIPAAAIKYLFFDQRGGGKMITWIFVGIFTVVILLGLGAMAGYGDGYKEGKRDARRHLAIETGE